MIPRKFKKRDYPNKKRASYLRYDDVFMSKNNRPKYNEELNRDIYHKKDLSNKGYFQKDSFEESSFQNFDSTSFKKDSFQDDFEEDPEYFEEREARKNILDERMVKYQKRQLPPLQRYGDNNPKNMYEEYRASSSYWDEEGYDGRGSRRYKDSGAFFKSVWQKFLITFGSILFLVCVSWIAYNCGSREDKTNQEGNIIIEPETSTFKVLPNNPGGSNVPHQDKLIYDKISGSEPPLTEQENQLLTPPEAPAIEEPDLSVDEYSIIDEKIYYIKIATNKSRNILENELGTIKNKYSDKVGNMSCSVKTIRDKDGEKKYAILIGPMESKQQAIKLAKTLNADCSVIAVKE